MALAARYSPAAPACPCCRLTRSLTCYRVCLALRNHLLHIVAAASGGCATAFFV
ncbi:hypothetical protein LX36DRAFT_650146 [Colletotrichum falcatum]|nr:hypothetical protein LX36DRAFT_650146 [Colletotrichum falcatum]